MLGFFPLAIVGPIVGPKFGLGRACVDCVESREGRIACHGFGAGCLGARFEPDSADRPFEPGVKPRQGIR